MKSSYNALSEKNYETLCFCKVTDLSCIYKGIQPRGSVVITKPLASQMSLRARKASWLCYMTLYH